MPKNPSPEEKPKVSKLPLPISDSPLVIDLPDGQKIVVGKMTSGSVIEVATWRGVGRPDSRTSRLMLGVASGNVEDDSQPQSQQSTSAKPVKPTGFALVGYYLQIALQAIASIPWKKIVARLTALKPKRKENAQLNKPSPETAAITSSSTTATSSDPDIEEWLNRISQRAANAAVTRTSDGTKPAKKAPAKKKVSKKPSRSKSSR